MNEPYRSPRQASTREASAWENELADALEAAFSEGAHDLDALVARMNASRMRARDGRPWTPDSLTAVLHELGA